MHGAIQIVRTDGEHGVHAREIDGHTALRRVHMPFKRRAAAKGNQRYGMLASKPDDVRNLFRRFRPNNGRRRFGRDQCDAVGMVPAHRLGSGQTVGEKRGGGAQEPLQSILPIATHSFSTPKW